MKLSSRTRFEQRFQTNGRDTGFRLRQMLRAAVLQRDFQPDEGADAVEAGPCAPVRVVERGEDLGPGALEFGYMNQTARAPAGRVAMDHIVSLNLFLRQ
jgi:hypothetical protein